MMAATDRRNTMTLHELLEDIVELTQDMSMQIQRLVLDSRNVQAGDVFIALPGLTVDGREFIDKAIANGAMAVLWECEQGAVPIPIAWRQHASRTKVPVIAIEDLTHKVGVLADRYYHHPSKSLSVIGITGTNGKTSCSQFIAQAIEPDTHCGVMGTLGWGFLDKLNTSSHTTPDAIRCHQWLYELQQQGAKSVTMEVSSHALDQGRVVGVDFDCAVFTNLSHDHLDYHGDMASYGKAKQKLFLSKNIKHHIINIDDPFGAQLVQQLTQDAICLSYGLNKDLSADISATEIIQNESGLRFTLHTPLGRGEVQSHVYGKFNIYNLLATASVMLALGYDLKKMTQRLSLVTGVAGRMQVLTAPGHPVFVIDYAHTPDALAQALLAIRDHFSGKLCCVFGCGGDRDKQKRPKMAAIAEANADDVVLTSDNPRTESAMEIVEAMLSGFCDTAKVYIELDREAAIVHAHEQATAQDVILVAGKGHEDYQIIGDKKLPFSDKAVIEQLLAEVDGD